MLDLELTNVNVATESDSDLEDSSPSEPLDLSSERWNASVSLELPIRPKHRPIAKLSHASVSELTFPKSQYINWKPPIKITPEAEAVVSLMVSISKVL